MPEPVTFDLEEVVQLDPADTTVFTPDHKAFLEEHKDELTSDELVRFGFDSNLPKPLEVKTDGDGVTGKSGDEIVDPKDKEAVGKVVQEKMAPILERQEELNRKTEINAFLVENPSFTKYRESIEAYKNHPNYKNIPVNEIARMVAAGDLMKMGARAEREAARKAASTQSKGSSARPAGGTKDWGSAAKDDYLAKRAEVMGHR